MSITACGTRPLKDNYLTWPHGIRCGTPKMQAADTNALVVLFCLLSRANCTVRWSCKWLIPRSSFLLFPIRRTALLRFSDSHLLTRGLPDIKERLSHLFYPEDGSQHVLPVRYYVTAILQASHSRCLYFSWVLCPM